MPRRLCVFLNYTGMCLQILYWVGKCWSPKFPPQGCQSVWTSKRISSLSSWKALCNKISMYCLLVTQLFRYCLEIMCCLRAGVRVFSWKSILRATSVYWLGKPWSKELHAQGYDFPRATCWRSPMPTWDSLLRWVRVWRVRIAQLFQCRNKGMRTVWKWLRFYRGFSELWTVAVYRLAKLRSKELLARRSVSSRTRRREGAMPSRNTIL